VRSIDSIDEMYVNLYYIIIMIFPMQTRVTERVHGNGLCIENPFRISTWWHLFQISTRGFEFWYPWRQWILWKKKLASGTFYTNKMFCRRIYCLIVFECWKTTDKEVVMSYDITFCVRLIRGAICKWAPKLITVNW